MGRVLCYFSLPDESNRRQISFIKFIPSSYFICPSPPKGLRSVFRVVLAPAVWGTGVSLSGKEANKI